MMSDDAKAIILLCGRLGKDSDAEPLQQSEYTRVVRWLLNNGMRPSDLLNPANVAPAAVGTRLSEPRLALLLKRGVQLGFAVETWSRSNIWVICRSDADYPARYRTHLKDQAPPILYGVGNRSLLKGGGLAIVGSRNIDAEAEDYTRGAAEWCARGGLPVVSGGARGVDQIAMKSALDAGGCVVGVLVENLLRNSVARDARKAIADDRLLLISPYHPEARFTVGTAMARNKLIYAMADYGLVVSADHNKGGTWAGATEELKRKPGRPVFVRTTGTAPVGNRKLLDLGALPFPEHTHDVDPIKALQEAAKPKPAHSPRGRNAEFAEETGLPLFDVITRNHREPAMAREAAEQPAKEASKAPERLQPSAPATIYEAVLPVIVRALDEPASVDDLSKRLDVAKAQLQKWLKQAVSDKKITKISKPVRYQRRR